jgi:hypothetical protein
MIRRLTARLISEKEQNSFVRRQHNIVAGCGIGIGIALLGVVIVIVIVIGIDSL